MDGVVASVYAFGSAELFPKGRRYDRKFWDAHAEIEGFYFRAALPGAQHLERCFATPRVFSYMTRRAFRSRVIPLQGPFAFK